MLDNNVTITTHPLLDNNSCSELFLSKSKKWAFRLLEYIFDIQFTLIIYIYIYLIYFLNKKVLKKFSNFIVFLK